MITKIHRPLTKEIQLPPGDVITIQVYTKIAYDCLYTQQPNGRWKRSGINPDKYVKCIMFCIKFKDWYTQRNGKCYVNRVKYMSIRPNQKTFSGVVNLDANKLLTELNKQCNGDMNNYYRRHIHPWHSQLKNILYDMYKEYTYQFLGEFGI